MRRTFSTLLALTLLFSASPFVHAFINTEGLTESLDDIQQGLGGGDTTGLGKLLEDLDTAAGENVDQYLQVTVGGKTTTMWDIPKSAWFYSYVLALTELGIVSGYKDASGNLSGEYGPGNNVTHAEALKIALGSAGVDPDSCSGFLAHPKAAGHWAEQYVICAAERDMGLASSTDLNAAASRAEVLHYVLKAFGVDAPDGNPPFADSTSHKYKNDIAYAYALEIISGDDGKGTFRPNDTVNRAEFSKIAKLAIELL